MYGAIGTFCNIWSVGRERRGKEKDESYDFILVWRWGGGGVDVYAVASLHVAQ